MICDLSLEKVFIEDIKLVTKILNYQIFPIRENLSNSKNNVKKNVSQNSFKKKSYFENDQKTRKSIIIKNKINLKNQASSKQNKNEINKIDTEIILFIIKDYLKPNNIDIKENNISRLFNFIKIIEINRNITIALKNKKINFDKKNFLEISNYWTCLKEIFLQHFNKSCDFRISSGPNKKFVYFFLLDNEEIMKFESNKKLKPQYFKNFCSLFLIKYFLLKNEKISLPNLPSFDFAKKKTISEHIYFLINFSTTDNFFISFNKSISIKKKNISSSSGNQINTTNFSFELDCSAILINTTSNRRDFLFINESKISDNSLYEDNIPYDSKHKYQKDNIDIKNKVLTINDFQSVKLVKNNEKKSKPYSKNSENTNKNINIKMDHCFNYYLKKYPFYREALEQIKKNFTIPGCYSKYKNPTNLVQGDIFALNKDIFNRKIMKFYENLLKNYFKDLCNKKIYLYPEKREEENKDKPQRYIFRISKQNDIYTSLKVENKRKRFFIRYFFINVILNYFGIPKNF